MPMSNAERAELRSLVKRRMKVLRADVTARESELRAEVHNSVRTQMEGEDALWAQIEHALQEAESAANRAANDAMRQVLGDRWKHERRLVQSVNANQVRAAVREHQPESTPDRNRLVREAERQIETMVKDAQRKLERIETDLLTELTIGALESEEAKAFLARIPTVGELVSAERLREITS